MRELGSLESETMQVVWSADGPVIVHDVVAVLNTRRQTPLAYTTVMTVMNKLVAKGWLHRERHGRSFSYTPIEDKAAYTARTMAEALGESADTAATLVGFIERLGPEEAAALRAALRAAEDDSA